MMKSNKKTKIIGSIIAVIVVIVAMVGIVYYNIQNSAVKPTEEDILGMVDALMPYLVGAAVFIVFIIVALFISVKLNVKAKFIVRSQSLVAFGLFIVVFANLVVFGPCYSVLSLVLGEQYMLAEETIVRSEELVEEIAGEGVVLLKNTSNTLPLADATRLNVFGWSATNPVYGGTGSGSVDTNTCVSLLDGLENAGFELNNELISFYKTYRDHRPEVEMGSQDWTVPEPTIAEYEATNMFNSAKEFSDTACIVISRSGGENADLPMSITDEDTIQPGGIFGLTGVRYTSNADDVNSSKHYLELSNREIEMIKRVTKEFANVVVIINAANPMELGWVEEYSSIKSVLWCPGAGEKGFNALGSVLNGSINPSGRLVDTYVYDLLATPIVNNFGNFQYDNMRDIVNVPGVEQKFNATFVNYVEGIFVGYKFYETAAAEGLIDFDEVVQYPFGYGLSYTEFEQELLALTLEKEEVTLKVRVTNIGDKAGKEVVQAYYTPPYYNGGIEKSEVNLIQFEKSKLLNPGESEEITLTFVLEDMASYDAENHKAYVLEEGVYDISIRRNSHHVIDSQPVRIASDVVYSSDNARDSDQVAATNQFDFATGDVTYLSRANAFENYAVATAAPTSYSMSEEERNEFLCIANYHPVDYNNPSDVLPILGVNSDLDVRDMIDVDYDDVKWDTFLNQLTVKDMNTLIAFGGYQTAEVKSIDAPRTIECDGPASIYNNFTGQSGTAFTSPIFLAATWNKELAKERGRLMGRQCDDMNVSGWYGPAMNIHRSAFSGRNFEYYSEDGVLSGYIGLNEVQGASEYKVAAYIKHFALNDQEENRKKLLCTWSKEQAIREIYLKPFEMTFKQAKNTATMSSFNYIGNQFAGACSALLQTVLRDEWGFRGVVVTDWFSGFRDGYMDADQLIRNGNDRMLTSTGQNGAIVDDVESATSINAMRTASKNILYSIVNSNAMNERNFALPTWIKLLIGINLLLGLSFIAIEVWLVKKTQGVQNNKMINQSV